MERDRVVIAQMAAVIYSGPHALHFTEQNSVHVANEIWDIAHGRYCEPERDPKAKAPSAELLNIAESGPVTLKLVGALLLITLAIVAGSWIIWHKQTSPAHRTPQVEPQKFKQPSGPDDRLNRI